MKLSYFTTFTCSLLLSLIGLISCSDNSPEAVAKDFVKALYSADFKKAKTLCTTDTQEGIDMIASMGEELTDKMKSAKVEVETTNCELNENGEEATVLLNVKNRLNLMKGEIDSDVHQEKVRLIKQEGQWKVIFKVK